MIIINALLAYNCILIANNVTITENAYNVSMGNIEMKVNKIV